MTSLSDLSALLDSLTSPIPTALSVPHLLNPANLTTEHELGKNPLQIHRWTAYIKSIKEEVLTAELDARGVATALELSVLGHKLSTEAGRLGLQKLTDIYERALQQFPTSFSLWKEYLAVRSLYVLGKATVPLKLDAPKKKRGTEGMTRSMMEWIEAGKGENEEISEGDRDIESSWEGALDGIVGWKEWISLAAVHERALMWSPNVGCSTTRMK